VYRLLGQWLLRFILGFAVCFVAAWVGDFTLFELRGKPTSTVTVNRYMGIPLKGQKEEYDYLGEFTVPCSNTLFPQGGDDPCWHLRRNPNQWENL
jgi:hypothetical protein